MGELEEQIEEMKKENIERDVKLNELIFKFDELEQDILQVDQSLSFQ